jgi:hypothetical protein
MKRRRIYAERKKKKNLLVIFFPLSSFYAVTNDKRSSKIEFNQYRYNKERTNCINNLHFYQDEFFVQKKSQSPKIKNMIKLYTCQIYLKSLYINSSFYSFEDVS